MSPEQDRATRERIVTAATELVLERGYEAATMREIAQRADVSLGSAYHYFRGKEELIGGIYLRIAQEHADLARERIDGKRAFLARLEAAVGAYLDVVSRYRSIAEPLLSLAIVPSSSLSPFSVESSPTREITMGVYRQVIDGSDLSTDARLLPDLPQALWLMHMGITLAWVHDTSPGQELTRQVLARSLPALDRILRLGKIPLFRQYFNDAVEILRLLGGHIDV